MALSLYNILDIVGVILGLYLIYLLAIYLKKEKENNFTNFLKLARIGIVLWVLNNLWHVLRQLFNFKQYWGEAAEYPEYLFIMFAYLAFVIAAYHTKFVSKQFAFKEVAPIKIQKKKGGKKK